jgi:large subunit ribosomal protein L26e
VSFLLLLSGATVSVGVDPSKCIITKLKMDKDRRALLERKAAGKAADKGKGKFTEQEVQAMAEVD